MNTTEANVFRFPVNAPAHPAGLVYGTSQETGVVTGGGLVANPLSNVTTAAPCPSSDNNGGRWRTIGTSQEVASVQTSDTVGKNTWGPLTDGIGYAFNGFGNFSNISGNAAYGYVSINGVDPIFAAHPANNQLPVCAGACGEASLWAVGTSYPNVRNGTYTAWSVLRVVTNSPAPKAVTDLVAASQDYVVNDVPDFVPAVAVGGDPGLKVWRSHYQQWDGTGTALGAAPSNGTFNAGGNSTGADAGGDMGGCVLNPGSTLKKFTGYIEHAFGDQDTPGAKKNTIQGPCPKRVD